MGEAAGGASKPLGVRVSSICAALLRARPEGLVQSNALGITPALLLLHMLDRGSPGCLPAAEGRGQGRGGGWWGWASGSGASGGVGSGGAESECVNISMGMDLGSGKEDDEDSEGEQGAVRGDQPPPSDVTRVAQLISANLGAYWRGVGLDAVHSLRVLGSRVFTLEGEGEGRGEREGL